MDKVEKERRLLVFAVYSKLLNAARHHGMLQTNYRLIASTWLLATFAAIGLILSAEEALPFNDFLSVAIVSLIGDFGLLLLWYEDSVVQELLLDLNVLEAFNLEKKERWLPQLHHTFVHLYSKHSILRVKVVFFSGCKTILLFLTTISLAIYFYSFGWCYSLLSVITTCGFNYLISRMMIKKSTSFDHLAGFLANED